ncbi:MAG: hypothetical protein Q7U23_00680 [Methylococcales bacterium]|nr:hypothetical protein [Methylococcales bacterium]
MTEEDAINKLIEIINQAEELLCKNDNVECLRRWNKNAEIVIEKFFGRNSKHLENFNKYGYASGNPLLGNQLIKVYQGHTNSNITVLKSCIDEIKEYGFESSNKVIETSAIDKIKLIIKRFHQIARQLRKRHSDRATLEIEDEYDVQDLFHALLKLYFDDVRAEEWTPSYAGSASRVDFLLKNEQIIIEIKKTRQGLKNKEVGEQLIIDTHKYQTHPDCKNLICFVYDPEGRISNPRGIENDLSKEFNGLPVLVFITPH